VKIIPIVIAIVILIGNIACRGSHDDKAQVLTPAEQTQAINMLRTAYAAFNRGDIAAAVEGMDPEIEWVEPAEFPGGGTYRGKDGVKAYLTQSRESAAEVHSEPERFISAGDRIVVFVHARVRAKDSSQWQDVDLADVYTFSAGKPVKMRAFANRQEALRWVGIQE
jgi:ketosteroid isomerase-like protein